MPLNIKCTIRIENRQKKWLFYHLTFIWTFYYVTLTVRCLNLLHKFQYSRSTSASSNSSTKLEQFKQAKQTDTDKIEMITFPHTFIVVEMKRNAIYTYLMRISDDMNSRIHSYGMFTLSEKDGRSENVYADVCRKLKYSSYCYHLFIDLQIWEVFANNLFFFAKRHKIYAKKFAHCKRILTFKA